ncbi:MAG TPA: DUF4258 domain-containing protein [Candidatus Nanoarchaeia archaeon]|nr:DUF4258 domain-containing protein [Candidatus Nanoarchaeia archaeon]
MDISEENVKFTQHAAEQMLERGITKSEVIRVMQRGSRIQQKEGWLVVFAGMGVAYRKINKDTYRVKTVFWL